MLFDCHLHTPLCGHAIGEPEDYVLQAQRRGFGLLTFTCHIPLERPGFGGPGVRMARRQLTDYLRAVERARVAGEARGVEVLTGIEAEIFPVADVMEEMDEVLQAHSFDFVLGSLHHQLEAYRQWLASNSILSDAAIVDTYFTHLAAAVRTGRYHSIAHPDVIRMYRTLRGPFRPAAHEGVIRDFLRAAAETGVCLEVNTSGLIKGDYIAHPDPLILDWAAEMGVGLTVGSDSHAPHMLGQYFAQTLPVLREKGFHQVHYFRGGRRETVSLGEVLAALHVQS